MRTRVVRGHIYGWQVELFRCGQWERMPFVYSTRKEARNELFYYEQL
jgi:hypothetical protein